MGIKFKVKICDILRVPEVVGAVRTQKAYANIVHKKMTDRRQLPLKAEFFEQWIPEKAAKARP